MEWKHFLKANFMKNPNKILKNPQIPSVAYKHRRLNQMTKNKIFCSSPAIKNLIMGTRLQSVARAKRRSQLL